MSACVTSGPTDSDPPSLAEITLSDKAAALRSPAAYEPRPSSVEAIETHFAWVFLAGEHAYKLKKPIRNDFVDLGDASVRRHLCSEELRLNRRLASDVYLRVTPLVRCADGGIRLGARGEVVDWIIVMRRLPSEAMLDRMIARGIAPAQRDLAAIGDMLAQFYAEQHRIDVDPDGYLRRMELQMTADQEALAADRLGICPELLTAATSAGARAFDAVRDQLARRALEHRILEGHGDLRPEHICPTDPPRIIDSLEFSLDLRTLDPAEELAFLSLECAVLGRPEPADRIIAAYRRRSGDAIPARLFDFYRSRRAMVRAKLIAWHLDDPLFRDRAPWRQQAQAYLERSIACAGRALPPDRA